MIQQAIKSAPRPRREIRTTVAGIACLAAAMLGCAQGDELDAAPPRAGVEGTITSALAATTVPGLLAAGNGHTCVVVGGAIQCWGSNSAGQLGDGSVVAQSFIRVPVMGLTGGKFALAAGGTNSCVVASGAAKCWGENVLGQLGNAPPGTTTALPSSNVPLNVTGLSSGVQAIATGNAHSCAIVGGVAQCWGDNSFGQVGNNGAPDSPVRSPATVSGPLSGVQAVTAGGSHTCAIVSGGARCWGFNGNGQLGNATVGTPQPGDSPVPAQVTGLTSGVQAIAAGTLHTCAVVNGGVQCWGSNSSGQLGTGAADPNPVRAPVPIPTLTTGVLALAAGQSHTCALIAGGTVKCWGDNSLGQLGTGPGTGSSAVPVPVVGLPTGILALVAGAQHTCAASHDAAWCWGFNGSGQLAFDPNAGSQSDAPHLIAGLILGGCADGSDEQVFDNGMVGCAGTASFANRGTLCAPGYQPATALQWLSNRGAGVPVHNYWTNDPLLWSGAGTSACTVSLSIGNDCAPNPMRVCTAAGTDAEGNFCNWQHCGLYANAPDNFFGGCSGNVSAGTVCIPTGAPANACPSVKSCAKWENGIVRIPASGATLEQTTTFGAGVRHVTQTCHFLACDPPTITGSISSVPTSTCQATADARSNQLKAAVASSVAVEGNFDSVAALNQRSAEAQGTAGATRTGQTIQQFNVQTIPLGPPGVTFSNWDERWVCQNLVVNAAPATGPNDACGCNN